VKEAQAAQIRMESGLSTLEDECAAQGLDWEEVLAQRAREEAKLKELGLTLMSSQNGKSKQQKDDNSDENMEPHRR
jgi:capsid protein